jgi:hypothetical protein
MSLKQILENIVAELEDTQTLIAAIEGALIQKNLLDPEEVKNRLPKVRPASHNRLAAIRASIARLSDQPTP